MSKPHNFVTAIVFIVLAALSCMVAIAAMTPWIESRCSEKFNEMFTLQGKL